MAKAGCGRQVDLDTAVASLRCRTRDHLETNDPSSLIDGSFVVLAHLCQGVLTLHLARRCYLHVCCTVVAEAKLGFVVKLLRVGNSLM